MALDRVGTLIAVLWGYLCILQYGFHISVLNGLQGPLTCQAAVPTTASSWNLRPCVPMTPAQFGLVTAVFTIGGLVGSLSSEAVTRVLGRVKTLQLSALTISLGSAAVGTANTPLVMMIGRVVVGFGAGLATVTTALYLAELLPSHRGVLGILSQLSIVFGLLIGQSLAFPFAKATAWRYTMVVAVGMGLFQLILGLIVDRAVPLEDVHEDVDEETALLERDGEEKALSIKELFLSRDPIIKRGLIIVIVTQLAQQLCGISPVMYFSTRILTPVFQANSKFIALAVVIVKIPFTILTALVAKRVGSKHLLMFSALAMAIASLLLALGINLQIPILSVISILSFVSAFSLGLGPVPWAVCPQVIPVHARTAAGSIGLALNWSTNFMMGSTFLPLQEWLQTGEGSGEGNIFFLFLVMCLAACIAIRMSYRALERVSAE